MTSTLEDITEETTYVVIPEETYAGLRKIQVFNDDQNLRLGFSTDGLVHAFGYSHLQERSSRGLLTLSKFQGELLLPRDHNLSFVIYTDRGEVSGQVGTPGFVKTKTGEIDLELFAPLEVNVDSRSGAVNLSNLCQAADTYRPGTSRITGELYVGSISGDIRLVNRF